MIRGLYTAYTGMRNEQRRLDIISNNVANSATYGYKEEGVSNQSFEDLLTLKIHDNSEVFPNKYIGKMSLGVKIGEVYTNYDQGSFVQTDGKYDLAIEGKGFFQVSTKNNKVRYTRNGSFTMTNDGRITDFDGNELIGRNGIVRIPNNAKQVVIDSQGNVFADDRLINQIQLVDFNNYDYLQKVGDTMYEPVNGARRVRADGLIRQGYIEQSNVNVIDQMVNLINTQRAYETNQKVIKTVDSMTDGAVNTVGRV